MSTRGLVKVTIDAAERRIDLALPDRSTVAELLPSILRHAGDGLADEGALQGGWVLRRPDGDPLEIHQDLASQQVRDGEILHLAPARQQWPELEYDDIVDAIATGARTGGREWNRATTRWCGLAVGSTAVVAALGIQLRQGPPWGAVSAFALGVAGLLLLAGTVLARVVGDARAGMVACAAGVVCAGVGGALVPAGDYRLSELGAPHLTVAGAALLMAGLASYVGIARHTAVFVAACTAGFLAVGAGLLATGSLNATRAAAVVATVAVALLPAAAPLAMRIGRLPKPVLPSTTADLLSDAPQPPRAAVYAAVLRTAALYTGMVAGLATGITACLLVLSRSDFTSARILVLLVIGICLLRARLLPVLAHRLSLLIAGLVGAAGLVLPEPAAATPYGLVAFAAAVVFLGLWYARNRPSAYFARYAELAEILLVLMVVPVLMAVLGLYGYLRGLGG